MDLQTRWQRGDFSGERRGIPRNELEVEARARGIELSEYILDDFKAMERFIAEQDAERINAQQEPTR